MQAEIDRAAGIIWRCPNEHGEMTLSKLKQGTSLGDQALLKGVNARARDKPVPGVRVRTRRQDVQEGRGQVQWPLRVDMVDT